MANSHPVAGIAVSDHDVIKQRHPRLANRRISRIDHRWNVHTGRREGAAHGIAGRAVAVFSITTVVEPLGVNVEYLAQRRSRACDFSHPVKRFPRHVVHLAMGRRDLSEQDGPFSLHIIAPIGDRVFHQNLIICFNFYTSDLLTY